MAVIQLIETMFEQYCVICFGFLHIHQRNYLKLVRHCCDRFEQVNGGCLPSWHLPTQS